MYDGAKPNGVIKKEWRKYLNEDHDISFLDDPSDLQFNFRNSYQLLYYYRVK